MEIARVKFEYGAITEQRRILIFDLPNFKICAIRDK